ncbi:glycosyl transferase, family 39 [Nitratiruptor sp. YY08-26]|uniref:ArnT family glycosyltransferase n=1 Tax=unclassified Nitratiruptor TaxID=2624044 RepID=UPI001915D446|nr:MULTISPECIES: glycosyltransferase family 39 protein [unclassified Nitratiruptor]BCD62712.1 glycosyl transferase, family 39 [Nitratiruptor sp. YY08-13]BCD66648.1 glycosyl transferase, family 39 [Nitratiruptor sp. YY08-26]
MQNRALLLAIVFLSFYAMLGFYPLFNLDEGAFSEATREMLASHNFVTTYLNGNLRFDKPILIYWLQAASASVFGLNEFAMRLPSALAATLWVYLLYRFTKRFYDEKTAFWASFFMAGSLQISIIAKAAIADALLNMFIAASMFAFYIYYQSRQKGYLYLTFAAIGFGVLTKGPVAILIPFAVSLLFLRKNLLFWVKSVFNPVGIMIFLAIAAPWYIAEYLDQGQYFIEGFLLKHNLNRFAAQAMEGHRGGFFYYIPVILIGLLPFTSIFLKALHFIKNWFDTPLKQYLTIWFLFVFIFFSFSHTKLPHYIIYGYTPLFIFMALYFDKVRSNFLLILPYMLFHVLFLLLPFIKNAVLHSMRQESHEYYIVQGLEFNLLYIFYFLFATLLGFFLLRSTKERAAIVVGFVTLISLNFFIAKVYANAAEEPIKEAAQYAKKHNLTNIKMVGINTPSFSFYLGHITPRTKPKPNDIVFTKRSNLKHFKNFAILFQKNGVALIQLKDEK